MRLIFSEVAWDEYLYWQDQDKKTLKKINALIRDIVRNGNVGLGKPEPLKHREGYWSRRINDADRLVYKIESDVVKIAQCRSHYGG